MISPHNLLLKIHREREHLGHELETDFVRGVRYGLTISKRLIYETKRESDSLASRHQFTQMKWTASQFRHAIDVALAYFKRADRTRGIRILESAIEHGGQHAKIDGSVRPIESGQK